MFSLTRQFGELDGSLGPTPTRPFGELDGLLGPTHLLGEFDGLLDLIISFDGLDVGVSLSGIRCLGLRASFLEGLSRKSLSDLLRNLI